MFKFSLYWWCMQCTIIPYYESWMPLQCTVDSIGTVWKQKPLGNIFVLHFITFPNKLWFLILYLHMLFDLWQKPQKQKQNALQSYSIYIKLCNDASITLLWLSGIHFLCVTSELCFWCHVPAGSLWGIFNVIPTPFRCIRSRISKKGFCSDCSKKQSKWICCFNLFMHIVWRFGMGIEYMLYLCCT